MTSQLQYSYEDCGGPLLCSGCTSYAHGIYEDGSGDPEALAILARHVANRRTRRTEPKQQPGKSKQNYGTPVAFLDEIRKVYGQIDVDLAADDGNHVCEVYITEAGNSLAQPWAEILAVRGRGAIGWLNPPYGNIGPWMKKCVEESAKGARILALVPASVGSVWFYEHVYRHAFVMFLRPRLTFVGCDQPFPKDCMLLDFSKAAGKGFACLDWRSGTLE